MTKTIGKKAVDILNGKALNVIILFSMLLLALLYSDEIANSVRSGLSICASVIIPSVFPFMVIADFLHSSIDFSALNCFGNLFEKAFKINRSGLCPFILGILCGFPLGVKSSVELYSAGYISKDEAERLIGFTNNTGPAFLVSGIGLGLRNNITDGIILYLTMVLSSVIVGILFSMKSEKYICSEKPPSKKTYSLTTSIKQAGSNTLTVCSFLTFFACFCGLLRKTLGESYPYLVIISLLEVGSSTSILSKTSLLNPELSLILTSFAVSFSGLSVHMQALSFLSDTDLSTLKYFKMKLSQGLIASVITYITLLIK